MRNKFPDGERMFQQDLSPCRSYNVKAIFKKQIKCVKLARKLTRSSPHLEFVINNKIAVTKLGLYHHNQATVQRPLFKYVVGTVTQRKLPTTGRIHVKVNNLNYSPSITVIGLYIIKFVLLVLITIAYCLGIVVKVAKQLCHVHSLRSA